MPCFSYSASLPLRHLRLRPRLGNIGNMGKCGNVAAQSLEDQKLRERIREVLVGADDVRDLHVDVVHDAGEVVQRAAVGPHDHEIADLIGRKLDVPLDQVVEHEHPPGGNLKPQRERTSFRLILCRGLLARAPCGETDRPASPVRRRLSPRLARRRCCSRGRRAPSSRACAAAWR